MPTSSPASPCIKIIICVWLKNSSGWHHLVEFFRSDVLWLLVLRRLYSCSTCSTLLLHPPELFQTASMELKYARWCHQEEFSARDKEIFLIRGLVLFELWKRQTYIRLCPATTDETIYCDDFVKYWTKSFVPHAQYFIIVKVAQDNFLLFIFFLRLSATRNVKLNFFDRNSD